MGRVQGLWDRYKGYGADTRIVEECCVLMAAQNIIGLPHTVVNCIAHKPSLYPQQICHYELEIGASSPLARTCFSVFCEAMANVFSLSFGDF